MYCTEDQLIKWFGEQELIQRTDREPFTGVINQEVLDEAIVSAGKKIDGYLRSVYPLPLSSALIASSGLPEICGDIVRGILFKGIENEPVRSAYKDAIAWLKDVKAKNVTLGEADETIVETGTAAFYQGKSRFNWDNF
ncbi:MAG: gp436 family protein [Methylobacter sp.]